jgi:hypothetical protein
VAQVRRQHTVCLYAVDTLVPTAAVGAREVPASGVVCLVYRRCADGADGVPPNACWRKEMFAEGSSPKLSICLLEKVANCSGLDA